MTIGTLVHITAQKKLMIKISEKTYDNLHDRLYDECKKKNYPTERLVVYSRENDDGEEEHFAMVTPDKYDKQNMPKFERLLRKDINFSTRMKSYDFNNDDDERVCGINLELIRISQQVKPKQDELRPVKAWLRERSEQEQKKEDALLQRDMAETEMLNARKYGTENEFSDAQAEVKKLDILMAAQEKQSFSPRAIGAEDLSLPPVLERQKNEAVPRLVRRRRTPAGDSKLSPATEQELTGVAAEVKKLEDLIAANERAIGADE